MLQTKYVRLSVECVYIRKTTHVILFYGIYLHFSPPTYKNSFWKA